MWNNPCHRHISTNSGVPQEMWTRTAFKPQILQVKYIYWSVIISEQCRCVPMSYLETNQKVPKHLSLLQRERGWHEIYFETLIICKWAFSLPGLSPGGTPWSILLADPYRFVVKYIKIQISFVHLDINVWNVENINW